MNNEILNFCLKRGLLVDRDLLDLFSETSDVESVKLIIEKIKNSTNQNIITKKVFDANKEEVNRVFLELPEENQKQLEKLKIKLGLSIEISKEISVEKKSLISESLKFRKGGNVKILERNEKTPDKVEVKHFVEHFRNRFVELRNILQEHSELDNLVSINKISNNRQGFSIIGMVISKSVTKNKNLIFEIEDLTGKIKVVVSQSKSGLFKEAEEICLDSVIGFKGTGNKEIFFANSVVFPDSRLSQRKTSDLEEYALFIGDFHFGSKRFMKENFLKFLDYLNGKLPDTPEVDKIKYLFVVGDLVTGVGNYPNQENDLGIMDLEEQFLGLAELFSKVRSDIKIIISPGNHDGVRLMEPQPVLNEKYAWPLYNMKNVIITENPCNVNIGATENFEGFNILTYHGFSFTYYANNIPNLISKRAMNCPEEIMKYLLKNRHLAPSHGSNQYFPLEKDALLIRDVPDIMVSAHTHKCGVAYYNNVLLVSISCWEGLTPYQEKFGNVPDHCKVPMVNLKTRAVKILDFDDIDEDENKLKEGKNE